LLSVVRDLAAGGVVHEGGGVDGLELAPQRVVLLVRKNGPE